MCLEEMLLCKIPEGSLYYGETRRRQRVDFNAEMRNRVREMLGAMRDHMRRGYTPQPKQLKRCNACSLNEICLPKLRRTPKVGDYLRQAAEDAT